MSATQYSLTWRVSRAAAVVIFNIAVWVVVPSVIFGELATALPSSPIPVNTDFIYTYGAVITALQAIGTLTTGMAVSVPFATGSSLAEAYYIWAAVDGGVLNLSAAGFGISLSFVPLLFLLMLAPLFNAVKAPIAYLLDESEASRPAADTV